MYLNCLYLRQILMSYDTPKGVVDLGPNLRHFLTYDTFVKHPAHKTVVRLWVTTFSLKFGPTTPSWNGPLLSKPGASKPAWIYRDTGEILDSQFKVTWQTTLRSCDLAKIGQIVYPPVFLKGVDMEDMYYYFGNFILKSQGGVGI